MEDGIGFWSFFKRVELVPSHRSRVPSQLQKVKDDRAFYPNPTSDQIFPEKEIGFDLAFS